MKLMIEIRTAKLSDAASLTLLFHEDLGEPDCTKELVEKTSACRPEP